MVLVVLADMANGTGETWPSQSEIGFRTGLRERQVRISLQRLERLGLIASEPKGKSRLYRLCRQGNGIDHETPALTAAELSTTPALTAAVTPAHTAGVRCTTPAVTAQTPAVTAKTPALTAAKPSKNQDKNLSASSEADTAAAAAVSAGGSREELFGEGVKIAARQLGVGEAKARAFLGRLLAVARDDCAFVMAKLRECEVARPLDAGGWLVAAVRPFRGDNVILHPRSADIPWRSPVMEKIWREGQAAQAFVGGRLADGAR